MTVICQELKMVTLINLNEFFCGLYKTKMKELHNLDFEIMACYQENTNFLYRTIPHIRKKRLKQSLATKLVVA